MKSRTSHPAVLPDVLAPGLRVVFCGTAVGRMSAGLGHYYANPGNKFWRILHEIGLTPWQFAPSEYRKVLNEGIGMTNLATRTFGNDSDLRPGDFDVDAFREKMRQVAPEVIAFNGKRPAQEFYGCKNIPFGLQSERFGGSVVFVLPSTSGAACGWWDAAYWHDLAAFLNPD